jgi:outer membrane protein assembly factor BamB
MRPSSDGRIARRSVVGEIVFVDDEVEAAVALVAPVDEHITDLEVVVGAEWRREPSRTAALDTHDGCRDRHACTLRRRRARPCTTASPSFLIVDTAAIEQYTDLHSGRVAEGIRMARRLGMVGLLVALVVPLGACDWPMFGADASHTGVSADPAISKEAIAGGLALDWQASVGLNPAEQVAVVNGVVYASGAAGVLYAYDADGASNCAGTPKTCPPLWTAATRGTIAGTPAVVQGVVYVGAGNELDAFDAAGMTNCDGVPRACSPLWTATVGNAIQASTTVVDGVVYVGADKLYAFDAAGNTNCSGNPKTCRPLWSGSTNPCCFVGAPAVANGVVYAGADKLYAFDAAGSTNCSGTPKTCRALWTAPGGFNTPTVAHDVVYTGADAFDAAGNANCGGTPKTCSPLWTIATDTVDGLSSSASVGNGVEYVGASDDNFYAFDASGHTNCTGAPKVCRPLWRAVTGVKESDVVAPPAIANGVVYVGSEDGTLYAFDAAGSTNCGGTPKTCRALVTVDHSGGGTPVVANGAHVYIDAFGTLQAYGLAPK